MDQNFRQKIRANDEARLIPVGLEIARYHRLCHFSTLHSATASTHPSIVSACQLMNEDAARIQLADAIRLATPLGEIFPSPPTSDFILKCKLSSIQIGSIHRGKHSLNKVAIITADLELLAEVWDSYALEVDAGEKSTEAYAKAENQLRISNIKQKLVQSKRQWMLSHLVDAPQDHVVFDGTEDEESEVGEIDGGQLFSSGNRAIIYENRASIPTAVATRKRPRQPSSSPTRNIRRQMSPRNVPSDAAPVKDLSQMSHEQLQNYEKEICSQLPLLQIEIRELREALDKKSWQKGELMARLAPVNQLLTYRPSQRSEIVTHHPTARDSQPSISTVNRESFSDMANQNDSAAPQQFGNEHGTNRISQALQPTKSPSHGGLSPQSGEKDTSMVRSLEDNSTQPKSIQPPTNAAESQLSGSFPSESEDFVLESIEKPHESLKLAYLQASLETSPQDKPDRRSVDQEAMNQTTPLQVLISSLIHLPPLTFLQKREQSPVSELQTTPGTPQPKPAPNDEDTPEQPLYKAPIPTWDQSNMTAATVSPTKCQPTFKILTKISIDNVLS